MWKNHGSIYQNDLWYESIRIHFPFLDVTLFLFLTEILCNFFSFLLINSREELFCHVIHYLNKYTFDQK
jgi:hypothetical protein